MKDEEIRIGETYKIREWDDMMREFGGDLVPINTPHLKFVEHMKYLCGTEFTVKSSEVYFSVSGSTHIYHSLENNENGFKITADMLEEDIPEIDEKSFLSLIFI